MARGETNETKAEWRIPGVGFFWLRRAAESKDVITEYLGFALVSQDVNEFPMEPRGNEEDRSLAIERFQ